MRNPLIQLTTALIIGGSFIFSPLAAAENSVKDRLDEIGVKYEVDKDGDYKITYSYKKENRTQLVYVSGKTETVNGLVIREIFAPAAGVAEDKIDGKQALELLSDSNKKKMGSWEISGNMLIFNVKIPDDIDAKSLETVLDLAAEIADDMELKLTGKDDL